MSKVIQDQKEILWYIKICNLMREYLTLKNDVFFKTFFRAVFEFNKDKLIWPIEEDNQMDEQLDENQREIKNNFKEINKETNLFFKKFDEDEEGENEKKLKNDIIAILKLNKAFINNFE